ncbi:MAG TPA: peptide chain release factor N(5)-glutamine methyltransferase [Actinomycetota bacterium]|nr:peptide chain release factor N(5)-glutamine methyltransferase [Actinomycetota bacterium]
MPRSTEVPLPAGATAVSALRWAGRRLTGFVDSPSVDAEVLLLSVLGGTRARLYAAGDLVLTSVVAGQFVSLVERRGAGEPLQYLTGRQVFRGLDLQVGPGVLVPRPETEVVVERALALIAAVPSPVVVDVGTGSGAIALAIAAERPSAAVWATEVSGAALAWAGRNAAGLGLERVAFVEGDLLSGLPRALQGTVDLVVANPPYLPQALVESAAADVRDHEPRVALVSGPTGLEVPSRLIASAWAWLRPGGWLVMETWPGQAEDLVALLGDAYGEVAARPDLAGSLRMVEGRRPVRS